MKKILILFLIFFSFLLFYFYSSKFEVLEKVLKEENTNNLIKKEIVKIKIKEVTILAEVADTKEERAKGLMNRTYLDEYSGMLFVFENSDYHSFWMKNTLIPLENIFIDENMKIIEIIEMEPCIDEGNLCKIYTPKSKIKYALEVNQNFSKRNNISIGDKIEIK